MPDHAERTQYQGAQYQSVVHRSRGLAQEAFLLLNTDLVLVNICLPYGIASRLLLSGLTCLPSTLRSSMHAIPIARTAPTPEVLLLEKLHSLCATHALAIAFEDREACHR